MDDTEEWPEDQKIAFTNTLHTAPASTKVKCNLRYCGDAVCCGKDTTGSVFMCLCEKAICIDCFKNGPPVDVVCDNCGLYYE